MDPNIDLVAAGVRVGVLLLLLFAVFQLVYLPSRVEALRCKLFSARRDLFLYMSKGHVDPADPAYRELREHFNRMLRFAERVTFARGLLGWIVWRRELRVEVESVKLIKAVKDDALREELMKIKTRVDFAVAVHLLTTSIPALVSAVVLVTYHIVIDVFQDGPKRQLFQDDLRRRQKQRITLSLPVREIEREALTCAEAA